MTRFVSRAAMMLVLVSSIASTGHAQAGGDPVNAATLDAVLKGLNVAGDGRTQVQALNSSRDAKAKERSQLSDANNAAIQQWHDATGHTSSCISDAMAGREKGRQAEMQTKMMQMMSDPAAMQRFQQNSVRATQQFQALMAKHDTAGANRAMADFYKSIGIDIAADSAAAYQTCGKPAAKPAALGRIDALSAQIDSLNNRARDLERETNVRAVAASGMPADKFGQARERVYTWYQANKQGKKGVVTKGEEALFTSHASDIEKVSRALQ